MNITIQTIPHKTQRYNTVGDWTCPNEDTIDIKISDTGNWAYNALLIAHELVESILCKWSGITSYQVDDWDFSHPDHGDPGSILGCPYYVQHITAMGVEMILCAIMGVNWNLYEKEIELLCENYDK